MARTDYGAILSTKIADTSQAIRDVNRTVGTIAPADWGTLIRAMKSGADYQNALDQIIEETVSGSIASFTDGANQIPCKEVVCHINPTETGTGEKSPSNPYVIGGFTEINVTNANKAIVSDIYTIEPIQAGTGNPSPTNKRRLSYGLSLVRDDDSVLNIWGGELNIKTGELIPRFEEYVFTGSESWAYSSTYKSYYTTSSIGVNMIKYGAVNSFIGYAESFVPFDGTSWSSKTGECCIGYISDTYDGFRIGFYANQVSDVNTLIQGTQVIYETATPTTIQLSATELERAKDALGITTNTVPFGRTVYGGTLNVTAGVLTIDKGLAFAPAIEDFTIVVGTKSVQLRPDDISLVAAITNDIISETATGKGFNKNFSCFHNSIIVFLTFPDDYTVTKYNEYVAGTKILYPLATPIIIQLTPTEIKTLLGANDIYHDCNGDTDVTYRANGELYVEQHTT